MKCLRCGLKVWEGEGWIWPHRGLAMHRLCALRIGTDHARILEEKRAELAELRMGRPRNRRGTRK